MLHTCLKDLGNGLYDVEFFLNQFEDLVVEARHQQAPDKYKIEIAAEKVQSLTKEFGDDFEFMSSFLKILNRRMVLLNPVSSRISFSEIQIEEGRRKGAIGAIASERGKLGRVARGRGLSEYRGANKGRRQIGLKAVLLINIILWRPNLSEILTNSSSAIKKCARSFNRRRIFYFKLY